jgi:YHS domain-containing protein
MDVPAAVETPAEITNPAAASSESLASFIPPSPAPMLDVAPSAAEIANPPAAAGAPEAAVIAEPAEVANSNATAPSPPAMVDDFPDPFPAEQPEGPSFEQPIVQSPAQPNEPSAETAETPFATTQPPALAAQPQETPSEQGEETFEPPIVNPYSGRSLEEPTALQPVEQPQAKAAAHPAAAALPQAKIDQVSANDNSVATKMRRIIQRADMKGLKGFCPVTLRDQRELADSVPEFVSSYRGQKFYFASQAALIKFDQHPERYAPAAYGADVVVLTRDQDVAEGTLDHAAWYRGRLYLFASRENHDLFVNHPEAYASPPGIE